MNIVAFLTQTFCGLFFFNILCGIVGSIIGAQLYKLIKNRVLRTKTKKNLVKIGTYFGGGSRTVYAMQNSTFHQVLLVGDYLKDIIISIAKLIMCCILALCLLFLLRDYWIAISVIIGFASILCGVEYRRLKDYLELYRQMFRYVFGEEYFKDEMEGIKQYWDKLKKKQ